MKMHIPASAHDPVQSTVCHLSVIKQTGPHVVASTPHDCHAAEQMHYSLWVYKCKKIERCKNLMHAQQPEQQKALLGAVNLLPQAGVSYN
jgi:hypothetical protein